MPLDITLEISDADLDYFRSVMHRMHARGNGRSAQQTAEAAAREVGRLRSTAHSPFILRRLDRVGRLVAMLDDPEWQLPEPERRRVLEGLAYVADVHDLVPDDVPALGLLDDAIMLELVLRELQHELDAYDDFDAYRAAETARRAGRTVSRADWLDAQREALHARMRDRRERDLARHGGSFEIITRF
ncbi:MAG TPA: YkvA family protein [Steroidobacteraceae bacterium]|jgi:uncharacterized membrane protein YkvA (DUF1232 family)|nr:YkvA family protein [Steroidobacteraceae bacterium]